jgi:hypothetical protein
MYVGLYVCFMYVCMCAYYIYVYVHQKCTVANINVDTNS